MDRSVICPRCGVAVPDDEARRLPAIMAWAYDTMASSWLVEGATGDVRICPTCLEAVFRQHRESLRPNTS